MKNKLFGMSLIILIGITLLAAVAFVLWQTTFSASGQHRNIMDETKLTADEFVAQSVQMEELTTNLKNKGYIVVKFNVLLESKKTKEEFEKRSVQAKSIIISALSTLTLEDVQGEEGIHHLEELLKEKFNEILHTGEVISVHTIDRKIQ